MRRFIQAALVGVLAVAEFSSSALALTASPTTFRGLSGTLIININTAGILALACNTSSISPTITNTASGVTTAPVSLPLGSVVKSTCRLAGTNVTITQASAWSGTLTALTSGSRITGATLRVVIPAFGLRIVTAAGCTFTISGALDSTLFANPTTTIPFTSTALPLTTDSASGPACAAAGIVPGLTARLTATYTIPTLTLSL